MRYFGSVFRPPSEADSYILQVTYGCSHNKCTFCGMYQDKQFRLRPFDEVAQDIIEASRHDPGIRRVFLADGDAMALKTDKLIKILDLLGEKFTRLERVGIYADAHGILRKSPEELVLLKEKKLSILYLGLESGSDQVLTMIKKGSTAAEMIEAVHKARHAHMQVSVIALLGVGGETLSREHAQDTAKVISQMGPDYFSALTLTLVPGTELFEQAQSGSFLPLSPEDSLRELGQMIAAIDSNVPIVFRTNHASNYVPLRGVLSEDKEQMLKQIQWALENKALRPERLRGL